MTTENQIFREVITLCVDGFSSHSRANYKKIASALAPLEPSRDVVAMLNLAGAGETMISPRFAYPHIEDIAREALSQRTEEAGE